MMYLFNANRLPESFLDYFSSISFFSIYSTHGASAGSIHLPQFSSNRLQHSSKFQGAKIWNANPNQIKIMTFSKYKLKLKTYLIDENGI